MTQISEYSGQPDADLIEMCLQGDAQAWEAIVRRYQRLVASITLKFRLEPEDSADVLQSVCLALLRQLPKLKKEAKLSSWIITVSVRSCWRLRQSHRKIPSLSREGQDQIGQLQDGSQTLAEDTLLIRERQHLLRQAIESLPQPCRRVMDLLFYQSEPYTEVSRKVGLPVASIGPTRARCLAKLRTVLMKNGFPLEVSWISADVDRPTPKLLSSPRKGS